MKAQILKRIGNTAYKLLLTDDSRIHLVIHVSLLKAYRGAPPTSPSLLTPSVAEAQPLKVLAFYTIQHGPTTYKKVLIQWYSLPSSKATWETVGVIRRRFPNYNITGSCWAFSAVAATEGITKISTGKLVSLSEQEIVDCNVTADDQGCNRGEMDDAFKYIIKNKGITNKSNYPYTASDDTCNAKKASSHAASIFGYENVPTNDEAALLKAAANQPIAVAIDASDFAFQMYSSGVFTGEYGTDLDHGVTVVGYGGGGGGGEEDNDGSVKYWLVKNSWGMSWGEDGYIRMERDVDAKEGLCC